MASGGLTPAEIIAALQGPALEAPPGETYNLADPKNSSLPWFILTLTICFTVSTFAVFIRIYTRIKIIKDHGWEDYCCVVGWLIFIGYAVTTSILIRYGGGVHQWNVPLKNAIQIFFYTYLTELVYGISTLFLKTSILIQYRKVFTPTKKSDIMFWGTHSLNAITVIYYIAITFVVAFQCSPVKKAWDPLIQRGHCISNEKINISSGYFNTITDFAILLLPQNVIWSLQMPLRNRAAVSGIFLVGLFACVASILRLVYTYKVRPNGDITYEIVQLGFWTYAELASGIICACLPMFPKFFQNIRNNRKSTGNTPHPSWSSAHTRISPTDPTIPSTIVDSPSRQSFKSLYYELDEYDLIERSQQTTHWPESGEHLTVVMH